MKPQFRFIYQSMIALFTGVVFFSACKKNATELTSANDLPVTTMEGISSKVDAVAARNQQNIIFESGFEGSDPFYGFDNDQHCCSYSVTQNTSITREGSASFKAEIRSTDASTSGGYRAEVVPNLNLTNESEVWYGYSTYFENWGASGSGEDFIQWPPNNSTGSAVLSVWTNEGKFMVVRNPSGTNQNTYQSNPTTIVSNKWYDFVWHIKWSSGSDGIIELWIDGVKNYTYTGKTSATGIPYFKFGLNRWDNASPDRILYYDNLRIGNAYATYDDVKPGSTTASTNQSPTVSAGSNQTITLPTNTTILQGTASDPDGSIVSYLWTKVSGFGGTIATPNNPTTSITGLLAGPHVYNLKVTDNQGAVANSTVNVMVNPKGLTNQSPTVVAGSGQTITLPVSSVTLTGSATDPDGTIVSYLWTKVSGPLEGNITSPNSTTTTVNGLVAGSYVFNLQATDNAGGSGDATVSIIVNAITTPPAAGYTLTYQSGYDQLSDITTNNGQYGNGTISTTVYNTGPGSFYSIPGSVSFGTRSEVQYNDAAQNPTEGAIEYDVMYEVIVPDNGHSIQWHPNTSDGSASPGLYHINGKFCVIRWKNGTNYYQTGTLMTIQTQHWYHMRIEYKFAESNAYMRWYIDGTLYYDLPATASSWLGDGSGQYLKVGYNGWDANSSSSRIYYDNLKIWTK